MLFFRLIPILFFSFLSPLTAENREEPLPSSSQPTEEMISSPSATPVPEVSYEAAFFKMILSLVALLALVLIGIWFLRFLRQGAGGLRHHRNNSSLRILERKALSQKSILYLIEVNQKQLLISESSLEIRALTPAEMTDLKDN